MDNKPFTVEDIVNARKAFENASVNNVKSFEQIIAEHDEWAAATFPKATAAGALKHAQKEIKEIEERLNKPASFTTAIEFVDALFCIMDSARLLGLTMEEILFAGNYKMAINRNRQWNDNGDGSYSHIKE